MKKRNNELSVSDNKLYIYVNCMLLTVSVAAALLFAFLLAPLTVFANSDGTVDYLADIISPLGWLLDLIAFFACYAITVFSIYKFKPSRSLITVILFSSVIVLKYLLNMFSAYFIFDTLPATKEAFLTDVSGILINTLAELLQYLIIVFVAYRFFARRHKLCDMKEAASKKLGVDFDRRNGVFPIKKIISFENPIERVSFIAAVIVAVVRVSVRLYSDIATPDFSYGGLPKDIIDALWMLFYYASDIIFGVLGYFFMLFILNRLDDKDIQIKSKHKN